MPDWSLTFKSEYDAARALFATPANFEKSWQPLVKRLGKLMDPVGFDAGEASALDDLRKFVKHGESAMIGYKTTNEGEGILRGVNLWSSNASSNLNADGLKRAGALKLLRHTYLLNKWGNKKVWVVSLPTDLHDWPTRDVPARSNSEISARVLLRSDNEIFSAEQKKHLAHSTREALAWCHKANMVLATAAKAMGGKSGSKADKSLDIVRRWFADPATTDQEMTRYINRLSQGFKDITAQLGKGNFVLTDWVPLRTASTQGDLDFLGSEAFTFAGFGEGMDVVYVEQAFFTDDAGGVVHGQKNWTRVILHELSHLVCNTEDVNIGRARYAWYGIGPHSGYPGSACIRNADNWAFFGADCAGVLTDSERNMALKII